MSLQLIVTLAALVTLAVAQSQDLTINTPTSAQHCLPLAITWAGGTPPYFVSLIPGGQPGGNPVHDFGNQTATTLTWKVDQPVGTSLTAQVRDSLGKINYSDKFSVLPSTQNDCSAGTLSSADKPGAAPTGASNSPANGNKPASSPTTSPSTTSPPPAGSPAPSGSTPSSGSPNTAATTGSNPASQAGTSDASRIIPGLFALVSVGALAIFA